LATSDVPPKASMILSGVLFWLMTNFSALKN
jgi:hypothetical protein